MNRFQTFTFFFLSFSFLACGQGKVADNMTQHDPTSLQSGLPLGEDCPAFDPHHVWGPDKGTRACPMCKYGYQQGVMVWVNTDDWNNIVNLASALEAEIARKGLRRFRAFIIYMNPEGKSKEEVEQLLTLFGQRAQLHKVAVAWVPSPTDASTAGLYKINPDHRIRNTVMVYKSRGVYDKSINLEATPANIQALVQIVHKAEQARDF